MPRSIQREVREALADLEREDGHRTHLSRALDFDQLMSQPAPRELVEGWLPAEGVAMVYGAEGVGKTLLLVGLDVAIRAGTRWMGRKTLYGSTLIYAGEGSAGLADRYAACLEYERVDERVLESTKIIPGAIDLESADEITRVIQTKRWMDRNLAATSVRMIAFDSLLEFLPGGEVESMARVSRGARAIARLARCCVLIGHHPNAAGKDRGTRHLSFRVHTRLRLERWKDEHWLIAEKQRHGDRLALEMTLEQSGPGVTFARGREMSAADYEREAEDRIAAAERRRSTEAHARQEAQADELLCAEIAAEPGISKTKAITLAKGHGVGEANLRAALDRLIATGQVEVKAGTNRTQHLHLNRSPAVPPGGSG